MLTKIRIDYDRFTKTTGKEPVVLRCSQAVYMAIESSLHCKWDGTDLRFINAEVIVDGSVETYQFADTY